MILIDDIKIAESRFWSKVNKTSTCWEWLTSKREGYGQFWLVSKNELAHRVSYTLHKGAIPEGYVIDHLCRNRACVNPDHLEVVTNRENVLRGEGITAENNRKNLCKYGHRLDSVNANGFRQCKKCNARRQREHVLRQKIEEL